MKMFSKQTRYVRMNAFALNVSEYNMLKCRLRKSTFFVNHEKITTFFCETVHNVCPASLIKVDLVEMNRSFTPSRYHVEIFFSHFNIAFFFIEAIFESAFPNSKSKFKKSIHIYVHKYASKKALRD